MIRTIDIHLNAAHPELPIAEVTTYVGAPSSVFIRGVPKSCGEWRITSVTVAVTFPDNSTTTRAAVESVSGVWVATIPATAANGRTEAGFRILADGVDENGAAVSGYVLGVADFSVCTLLPVPAPGDTFYFLKGFDAVPTTPKKFDVCTVDGVLKYFDGTAWQPFAAVVEVVAPSTDASAAGKAADAKATGDALADRYTKTETDDAIDALAAYYITYTSAGAAFPTAAALLNATAYYSGGALRVPTRNDYAVVLADETHGGAEWRYIYAIPDGATAGQWEPQYPIETNDYAALSNKPQINGHEISGNKTAADLGLASAADASRCKYSFTESMVDESNPAAALVSVIDHAKNAASLGASVTGATVFLPVRTDGYTRDMYISLTVNGSAAPTITFSDNETSTVADIVFGTEQLADIDTGYNLILFTEFEQSKWIVSVKHKDFPEVTP